jgi:hypothetical protein
MLASKKIGLLDTRIFDRLGPITSTFAPLPKKTLLPFMAAARQGR